MTDKIKIKVYCTTGFENCNYTGYVEMDRGDWDSMTKGEQDEYLDLCADAHLDNFIDYGAYVVKDEDE